MANRHRVLSTLAKTVLLGAVGVFAYKLQQNDKQAKIIADTAKILTKRAMERVKKIGSISKEAYEHLLDTLIKEYRGARKLSAGEMRQLKAELRASWQDVTTMLQKQKQAKQKKKR